MDGHRAAIVAQDGAALTCRMKFAWEMARPHPKPLSPRERGFNRVQLRVSPLLPERLPPRAPVVSGGTEGFGVRVQLRVSPLLPEGQRH